MYDRTTEHGFNYEHNLQYLKKNDEEKKRINQATKKAVKFGN